MRVLSDRYLPVLEVLVFMSDRYLCRTDIRMLPIFMSDMSCDKVPLYFQFYSAALLKCAPSASIWRTGAMRVRCVCIVTTSRWTCPTDGCCWDHHRRLSTAVTRLQIGHVFRSRFVQQICWCVEVVYTRASGSLRTGFMWCYRIYNGSIR